MLVRLLQPENAVFPISVTPSGIVTLVRLLQPENAPFPIVFNVFGNLTDINVLLLLNAEVDNASKFTFSISRTARLGRYFSVEISELFRLPTTINSVMELLS